MLLEKFDQYILNYCYKWKQIHFTDECSYIDYLIKLFHLFLIIPIISGPFLPSQLIPYYLVFIVLLQFSRYIFGGCILSLMYNQKESIPFTDKNRLRILTFLVSLSIFFYIFPQYSIFNGIYKLVNYAHKYHH